MAYCKIKTEIEILDNKGQRQQHTLLNTLTSVTELMVQEFDIAADGTQIIWDPTTWTGMQISAFDRMILYADGTLDVELTINEGHASEELISFRLIKDVPFILGSNIAYYGHSGGSAFAGTPDVIDKIRVDEPNTSARKVTTILVDA